VLLLVASTQLWAAEPLSGKWVLKSQEIAGQKTDPNPLTLAITPSGKSLEFAYLVTANDAQVISLKFTSPLDGTAAEVTGVDGTKIGTAKVAKDGASYKVLLEGPNRPAASGQMTVSADGKTLTSESDVKTPSGMTVHTVQVFSRQ